MQLARCLQSVQMQTAVADVEQIVVVDHVGVGIDGMYTRVPLYRDAVHGMYVSFLCDDDVLATPHVVDEVRDVAARLNDPPLILVHTRKNGAVWPDQRTWPPSLGHIDLNCAIVRADIWKQHVAAYGARYEGDWDFVHALALAGIQPTWCNVLFSIGAVSRGQAEAA